MKWWRRRGTETWVQEVYVVSTYYSSSWGDKPSRKTYAVRWNRVR